jgi:GDP/UDP-N,N'-diacetylbacillosamine 2-epimerase (hydrolysing)
MTDLRVLFTMPNADPGSAEIGRAIRSFAAGRPGQRAFFASLGRVRYLSAMKYCRLVAGNSSSGIIEAPSFGKPVVDIGGRQKGRVAALSVLHCRAERAAIVGALKKALTPGFSRAAAKAKNPYGDGNAASRICAVLRGRVSAAPAAAKKFYDL